MEFWGAEVKSGQPLKVSPGDGRILHLSQTCLGELKKEKGAETVYLFVNVDGQKFVLATLFTDKFPQLQFDLVFDRDFELSHNWKSGSVYFYGYKSSPSEEDEHPEGESDESESEEDIPLTIANNGKPEPKPKKEKLAEAKKANPAKGKETDAGKQKVQKDAKPEEDEESSDEDLMSVDDDEEDNSEDAGDSDDESGESDEETPKKAEPSKKRAAESATKTPVPQKNAKVTPQKTGGKKAGSHVATPHPAKQAGKTPANKPNQKTPKSGASHTCKSCKRAFGSEKALESHSKAKHASGK